jgi:hypothetical protein
MMGLWALLLEVSNTTPEALPPATRTAASVSNRNDLHVGGCFRDPIRKKTAAARAKVISEILLRVLTELIDCTT